MIIARSMHPDWLSNAFLVADEPGGHAVFIDAGAPVDTLMARATELDVHVTHVLLTHEHHDHTTNVVPLEERFGATLVTPEQSSEGLELQVGSLTLRAISTPGHCTPHVAWLVEQPGEASVVFTGDTLFRGTVGGTINGGTDGLAHLRASILDELLTLPPATIVWPGHVDATTIADELAHNPFVRAWRGELELADERVSIAGTEATLLLEAPDYDGGTKAWVRFDDGNEAIVGGSMVTRAGVHA